jgi:periplasmic divalent cation tolerance protein
MHIISIYLTCGSVAEADQIAQTLVREKLIACANRGAPVLSTYIWEGKQESSEEIPLWLKTVPENFEPVRARIRALHSYTTPAIMAFDLPLVDKDYYAWVLASVSARTA